MSKSLFVVGTGTDIGKTYVTALIVKKLHDAGDSVCYYKAAMSGNERDESGKLIPGDALHVKSISGISQDLDSMCPFVYERAVSPHLASRIEGNPVTIEEVMKGYRKVTSRYDYVTLEGSGGILCPIDMDTHELWLEDIVKKTDAPTVLIADAGLGTINYVCLTLHYMREKGIDVGGIIFNNYIDGDMMQEDNKRMCEYVTGVKVIGTVHKGDREIDIDVETLRSLYR